MNIRSEGKYIHNVFQLEYINTPMNIPLYQKIKKEGDYVPRFLIKLWQIRIKEKFGLEVDSDIAEVIVKIVHERSTWKTSRAEKYISALLKSKGESKEQADKKARDIVKTILE